MSASARLLPAAAPAAPSADDRPASPAAAHGDLLLMAALLRHGANAANADRDAFVRRVMAALPPGPPPPARGLLARLRRLLRRRR